jgi:hypothetical protein
MSVTELTEDSEEIRMKKAKRINPIELVQEQYQLLKEKFICAADLEEKKILLRRLMNLHGVKRYLMSIDNR